MRRVRVNCKLCRFYTEDGIIKRCTVEENIRQNWIGVVYKKHPNERNYKGECEDYEKADSNSNNGIHVSDNAASYDKRRV